MSKIIYLANEKINEMVFIKEIEAHVCPNGKKWRKALFQCKCGTQFSAIISHIKSKHTKSCGCYTKELLKKRNTTHKLSKHKLYKKWISIKSRCLNTKATNFYQYGGRGITICSEWENDFIAFYEWAIINGYQEELEIDRINPNGNYEPSNCRWANNTVQSRNTRIIHKSNTSGFRGVSWHKDNKKWRATININRKQKQIGLYKTAIEAAISYDNYVTIHGLEHTKNF